MNKFLNVLVVSLFWIMLFSPLLNFNGGASALPPVTDPFNPGPSQKFLANSQNIPVNQNNSLSDIYYYVGIMNLSGGIISALETRDLAEKVRSFQNTDGGFGDWYRDRSKAGSTLMALRTLEMLGHDPLNISGAERFIHKLQVTGLQWGNYGFRSSIKERDADLSSTFSALASLDFLRGSIPNRTSVVVYLKDHQNFDGGFGYQTNRGSGIFWDSTALHTHRGVMALSLLTEGPEFSRELVDFLTGLQDNTGGFRNTLSGSAKISYTYNAVQAMNALGISQVGKGEILGFVRGNQLENGGFLEYSLDTKEGIHTTFFALNIFKALNGTYDAGKVQSFARNFLYSREDGGFGDYPGMGSNVRFTFDAISALNLIGGSPTDQASALEFIRPLRNSDGGYGKGGVSNVETTFRSILTLQIMGETIEDASKTVAFLRSAQNNDGGFGFSVGYVSRGAYTYRSVRALEILASSPFNSRGAMDFLKKLQNEDGGFGNYFGEDDSDITSTYRAVRALDILGSRPDNVQGLEAFISGAQNPDGGFRRSPWDITAPLNFSSSIFTFGAALSLKILGMDLPNSDLIYHYVESLRNPDLGFGMRPFFTSQVSTTYTALWTYYNLYPEYLNSPPDLMPFGTMASTANTSDIVNFSVQYSDSQGQNPEYVHLVMGEDRHLMLPEVDEGRYALGIQLPPGNHTYYFEATDGLELNRTPQYLIEVALPGPSPALDLVVSPEYGLDETDFTFTMICGKCAEQPPDRAEIRLDQGQYVEMSRDAGDQFYHTEVFQPGIHVARARIWYGEDVYYTPKISGPFVYTRNSSRPDWEVFLSIKALILLEYNSEIGYEDVEREIFQGKLAWKVDLGDMEVYVSNDGTEILKKKKSSGMSPLYMLLALFIIILLLLVLFSVIWFLKKERTGNEQDDQDGEH